MSHPKKYNLLFSKGTPLLNRLLKEHIKTIPTSEGLFVSKKLLADIAQKNKEITAYEIPSGLQLSYINPEVNKGIFLKSQEKCLEIGTFIGIYTGLYELIKSGQCQGSHYTYNIAKEISLQKKETQEGLDPKENYCIQTNATSTGNFTRFINHSPLEPNVKAILSKFPSGRIEIILFALKKIYPGEQLLSNYGSKYWNDLHITPTAMTPTTYMLNSSNSVISTRQPLENSQKPSDHHLSEELLFRFRLLSLGYW